MNKETEREFDKELVKNIINPLIDWYEKHARAFPWRENNDPYRVWVSEIMLQQTRISTVLPYYKRFMDRLPTVDDLANIDDDELLKLWEGLGYYSRARHLKEAAIKINKEFQGSFPKKFDELITLPGIGDYTAGAVASICANEPVSAVDGNVLRVLCRYLNSNINVLKPSIKKAASEILNEIIPKDKPGIFNEAIMELGETICLPNSEPKCKECPLFHSCLGFKTGEAVNLPVREKKTKRKKENRTVFLIMTDEKVAIKRRPDRGLLANLWEFPNVLGELDLENVNEALSKMGIKPITIISLGKAKHIFSHIEWHMIGYQVIIEKENNAFNWVTTEELGRKYPLPTAFSYFSVKKIKKI